MEMHAHILLLLLSLIAHVHQCNTSDLTHKTILDIDDYQFHFSTFHYEFPILQPVSAVIEHPFDDHLNITLDVDLNNTITLSINGNLTLNFLNIHDFREITYASPLQHNQQHPFKEKTYRRRLQPGESFIGGVGGAMGAYQRGEGLGGAFAGGLGGALGVDPQQITALGQLGSAGFNAFKGYRRRKRARRSGRARRAKTRWERRQVRRNRRKRRRGQFKRWLKRHYGRGVKPSCPGNSCPHRHIHIRQLPKDMHWSPLSGLLPLLGAQFIHPAKKPKLQITAKVHVPGHKKKEELDYDLLSSLLFNEDDAVKKHKSDLMDQFDKKEKKLERLITGQKAGEDSLLAAFDEANGLEKKLNEDRTYHKWDEENDERVNEFDRRRVLEAKDNGKNDVYMVSHCRIVFNYELCLSYDAMEMVVSVDIKQLEYKVRKGYEHKGFRDVMDMKRMHYKDYRVVEGEGKEEHVGEYGFFEPIDGNLGYTIFKYECLDWHLVKEYEDLQGEMHAYGDFDNFKYYIRFNERFDLKFDGNGKECSVTLDGLPFKMCIKEDGMVLYFEKDVSMDVLDPVFSFQMKEFIDKEFEESVFVFDDDTQWDEVNVINMEQYIEKCSYLHVAKVCMKRENGNGFMTAYISFQFMNKAMPSI